MQLHLVTEDFPPFTYPTQDLQPAGPMIEVVLHICAQIPADCRIELLPWQRALKLAQTDQVDGIFSVIRSKEREARFHFTKMLVRSSYSVFSTTDQPFTYRTPADLKGRRIGVYGPSGTSYVLKQSIRQVSNVAIDMISDNRRLLRMLDSGRFGESGLIMINKDVALSLIADENLTHVREAGTLQAIEYALAFSKQRINPAEFARIERAVEQVLNDGSLGRILQTHQLEQPLQP